MTELITIVCIVVAGAVSWSLWNFYYLRRKIGRCHIMIMRYEVQGGPNKNVWAALCVQRNRIFPDKVICVRTAESADESLFRILASEKCVAAMPRIMEGRPKAITIEEVWAAGLTLPDGHTDAAEFINECRGIDNKETP